MLLFAGSYLRCVHALDFSRRPEKLGTCTKVSFTFVAGDMLLYMNIDTNVQSFFVSTRVFFQTVALRPSISLVVIATTIGTS